MGKRTSKIWTIPTDELKALVAKHDTAKGLLLELGYSAPGASIHILRDRMFDMEMPWKYAYNSKLRRPLPKTKSLEEVMVENSPYSRGCLKARLLKAGILENKCSLCGQAAHWHNKPLTLIMDHINGVNNDHRRENLRMLCPHCNSQQDTFAGRNSKRSKLLSLPCKECGGNRWVKSESGLCRKCNRGLGKAETMHLRPGWPSDAALVAMMCASNNSAVAKQLGVSDNGLRKFLKRSGLSVRINEATGYAKRQNPIRPMLKYNLPTVEELTILLRKNPIGKIARCLDIPDSAIYKMIAEHDIPRPIVGGGKGRHGGPLKY